MKLFFFIIIGFSLVSFGYTIKFLYVKHKSDMMEEGEKRLLNYSCKAWCSAEHKSKMKNYVHEHMSCFCENGYFGQYDFDTAFFTSGKRCVANSFCPIPGKFDKTHPDWKPQ